MYSTIQGAVNHSGKNATIQVKPGKYIEGVIVSGHKHDGLRIIGLTRNPAKVLIEGKNAKGPGGAAQNGIAGNGVNHLVLENMKAEHFAANGFYVNHCSTTCSRTSSPGSSTPMGCSRSAASADG